MNEEYLDKITHGDCRDHISRLADNSIELFLSDIPYGISLDDWMSYTTIRTYQELIADA